MNQVQPIAMSTEQAQSVRENPSQVVRYKQLNCNSYNACLTQAFKSGWANFSCTSCTAFQAISREQMQMDFENLLLCNAGSENVIQLGCVNRKRGARSKTQ